MNYDYSLVARKFKELSPRPLNKKFIIIIPFYNAVTTIKRALLSVLNQQFDSLGIILRDDMSNDESNHVISDTLGVPFIEEDVLLSTQNIDILYLKNDIKFYGGGATYDSVINYVSDPNTIVGVVDGDDYLLERDAVNKVFLAYQADSNRWLVWSQHQSNLRSKIGLQGYSDILPTDDIIYSTRDYWSVSHFRSCKAGLFHYIKSDDMLDPFIKDRYLKIAADAALLYPIIEMSGSKRCFFINEVMYNYSDGLNTNESVLYESEMNKYVAFIRGKPIYDKLPENFRF